jgi:hypothetical protein
MHGRHSQSKYGGKPLKQREKDMACHTRELEIKVGETWITDFLQG